MQLGLYRTTLAAVRLSSAFKVYCPILLPNRAMKSSPGGDSVNPQNKFVVEHNKETPSKSWNRSKDAFNEEFPPLSASIPIPKRKTRIDLSTQSKQKSLGKVEFIGPSQLEESTSTSHDNESLLPTSFGKKPSKKSKLRQTHHVDGEAKKSSLFVEEINLDKPFDICLPEERKCNGLKKNRGEWLPKMQSPQDDIEGSVEESGCVLRPGMVLFKSYIPLSEQVEIVKICRELGLGPGGFYRPGFNDGAKLRLHMMCLGLDWNAQTREYGKRREHDNATPPDIPREFTSLVSRVFDDSHNLIKRDLKIINVEKVLPRISPDVCLVNFYNTNGRLGLHQDRDESKESLIKRLPVISLSIGDSAEFLYSDDRDVKNGESTLLESGDVLIFGGESRHIFHGVTTIYPDTAPNELREISKLRSGRLNLTFRKY